MGWMAPPGWAEEPGEPFPLLEHPEIVEFVDAPYPEQALAAGVEGVVLLRIDIDASGAVTGVEVLRAAGHGFDQAAMAAAGQFRFSPAVDESGPVPVAIEFEFGFSLDGGEAGTEEPEEAPELPVNLEGTLRIRGTGDTLAEGVVTVRVQGEPLWEASSDAEGRFQFRGVPVGVAQLSVRHPGIKDRTHDVEITVGEVATVVLWLARRVGQDTDILALYEREKEPEVTRRTITMREVRSIPGTYGDPVRVIQNLPGVARSSGGRAAALGGVVIRGANPEDSRFFVDGVEVPLIYHLGNYASIFNGSMVGSVDYLPGGYGVQYGRGTGGVIQINTASEYSERLKLRWNADLLDTSLSMNGRIGKVGLSGAFRISYLHLWMTGLVGARSGGGPGGGRGGGGQPVEMSFTMPRWWDYQFKAEILELDRDVLSLLVFGFDDGISIETIQASESLEDQEEDDDPSLSLQYGTHQAVLRWDHRFGETLTSRLQPTVGYQSSYMGFDASSTMDYGSLVLGGRAAMIWQPVQAFELKLGIDAVAERQSTLIEMEGGGMGRGETDPLQEAEPIDEEWDGWQVSPDPYLNLAIRPLPDPERMVLLPGVRLSTLAIGEDYRAEAVDPRFTFRWSPFSGGTLKAGTGLYHQPPNSRYVAMMSNDDGDLDLERSWSTEVGWEQQFSPAISADVTYFHREMDDLVVPNPDPDAEARFANTGIGRADGMEVMLRHKPLGPFFGWVSYTLSRSERNDDPDGEDAHWYLFDYDQTHILTVLAAYRLPWDMEVSSRFQYVSGNPYTPFTSGIYDLDLDRYSGDPSTEKNSARMDPYINLDLRVEQRFSIRKARLSIYAELLGLVQGENPDSVQYNYDYTETSYVQSTMFIPSAGVDLELNF